ncbi:response regulator [Sphingomonas lacusdianchii]|uniref:response regulator n=1 Tax=Sphingomonas lacusdianchii TaxID=2917992 RepID=UPI001F57BE73|nr:response regulator [Sphingomonas sp. JXJ CY 53]
MTDVSGKNLNGQSVLLVEDDALVGLSLKGSLEELGASVAWATRLASALEAVQSGRPIDIAIVDINLAGEVSTPVLDRLMAMNAYTIICTGYDDSNLETRFLELPRCEKPFTRAKIRKYVLERI